MNGKNGEINKTSSYYTRASKIPIYLLINYSVCAVIIIEDLVQPSGTKTRGQPG